MKTSKTDKTSPPSPLPGWASQKIIKGEPKPVFQAELIQAMIFKDGILPDVPYKLWYHTQDSYCDIATQDRVQA